VSSAALALVRPRSVKMDWNFAPNQLDQVAAVVKRRWPKLTDEDLVLLGRKKEMFLSRLQQRYGMAERDAERELDRLMSLMDTLPPSHRTGIPLRQEAPHK
jgi:hypothetical protein